MTSTPLTGYECFDALIQQLRAEGYVQTAAQLHTVLHDIAWTTGSELMGELGLILLVLARSHPVMTAELRRSLDGCLRAVKHVWPDIT